MGIHLLLALSCQGFVEVSALPRFGTADTLPSADAVGAARRKGRRITNVECSLGPRSSNLGRR